MRVETGNGTDLTLTAGALYENVDFQCRVTMASNVTLRNCRFSGNQFRTVDTGLVVCPDSATGYLIEFCDFLPKWASEWWHGIKGGAHGTFRRNYFKNCVDAGNFYPTTAGATVTFIIEENFVHHLYWGAASYQSDGFTHSDCLQFSGGNGGTVRRNTLICDVSPDVGTGLSATATPNNFARPSSTGSCIALTPSGTGGPITNMLIEGNRLSYGKYGIAIVKNSQIATNVGTIRSNLIDVATLHDYNITGQTPASAKRGIAYMNTMSATFENNVDLNNVAVILYSMTVM